MTLKVLLKLFFFLKLPAQFKRASSLDENDDQNSEFERSLSVV